MLLVLMEWTSHYAPPLPTITVGRGETEYPGYKNKNLSLRPQRQKVQSIKSCNPERQRWLTTAKVTTAVLNLTSMHIIIQTTIKMLVSLSLNVLLWLYGSNTAIYSVFSVCESCCTARLVSSIFLLRKFIYSINVAPF